MTYRLGVDVGGTFTDLLLIDEDTGATYRAKTPSHARRPVGRACCAGIEKVCAPGRASTPAQIDHVMHGTTVATNAVLEGKGARVGLIVTRGYRQVLQVARSFVPGGLAGWIIWPKPRAAGRAGEHRRGGRAGRAPRARWSSRAGRGRPAAEARVPARRRAWRRVTVALINSFANPAHERRIAELVAPRSCPACRSRSAA